MACACIGIYRKERLDESFREILRRYQQHVIEDTCWFSIELEWHIKSGHTKYERQQLTEVFGSFPKQEIFIFGEGDRIFVAAYELIKHFGGLLNVSLATDRVKVYLYDGIKIAIHQKKYKYPERYDPDYWLVDHIFIKDYFGKGCGDNFERFKFAPFLHTA
jgi:hypothetical protein